jgi:RNA polymerase sigma-70 factor (ECF subfamily)
MNGLHDDLELARACGEGRSSSLAELRRRYGEDVRAAMRRCRLPAAEIEEAEARLWTRLLVGDPDGPKIRGYAGTGSLRAWLRRCAAHEALAVLRRRRPESGPDAPWELVDPAEDPERRLLSAEHAAAFRDVFAVALASLEPREREVLRAAVLDGESSVEIASRYGVHRVTVARWIAGAREKLARRTGRMLRDRLGPLARVALSRVDITLGRVLTVA